ncbi:MAG: hypothetical protein RL148_1148 [Planctomycetota bacterium]|jgi:DNA primase
MDRFEDVKLRVKEANDLVAMIESYLPLRPRGRTLVALCPFHQEKGPSFTVYPDSQHFHCYGCGKSGDVFTFLMEREGLTFREAFERLAERARISLEGVFQRGGQDVVRGPDPYEVLSEVRAFFHASLRTPEGSAAAGYLADRGLGEAVLPWSLGYHPAQGSLAAFAARKKLPRTVLEESGLLRNGRELFAGRVMFPIEDERGRVVGFGGRILPGMDTPRADGFVPPKYVNSPESPFFNKRKVLFGLHRAKLAGSRRIVVMEGYTDVIASHLAGFQGSVATLGTAFTGEHVAKIERYATEGLVLLFDGDRAGAQAAERAMRELVSSAVVVRIALMDGAKDPGEMLAARDGDDPDMVAERRARFADLLDGAEDALTVWFRLLRRRIGGAGAVQTEALAKECAKLLEAADSEVRRHALVEEMARHLAMPAAVLTRMVRTRPDPVRTPARAAVGEGSAEGGAARRDGEGPAIPSVPPVAVRPARPRTPLERAETDLLACMVAQPLLSQVELVAPLQFEPVAELMGWIREAVGHGRTASADVLRSLFASCTDRPDLSQLLAEAANRAQGITQPKPFLESIERGRQRVTVRDDVRSTRQQLQEALSSGNREVADELTRRLVEQLRQERPRST